MKKKTRTIKTAICVDPVGCMSYTPEEEIDRHIEHYGADLNERAEELGLKVEIKLDWYRIHSFYASALKSRTEMIIFDFGGVGYGNSLMEDNSRRLVDWAIEYPDRLICVASGFTYRNAVEMEMRAQGFDKLSNIVELFSPIPEWFMRQSAPPPMADKVPACMRCSRLCNDPLVYTECTSDKLTNICAKCGNIVCAGCFEPKKKLCGDCAKWK